MLRASRSRVLLGRPISVYGYAGGIASFVIAERGEGTRELSLLRAGEELFLEGPLGSGWPSPPAIAGCVTIGKRIVGTPAGAGEAKPFALVAGGIGLAPLAFLATKLVPNSYDIHAGFRNGSWGTEGLRPRELKLSTEDGSVGRKGRVLDLFEPSAYSAIFACGPEPMLRALAKSAATAGVPTWLSLERRIACGVGACLGCTVRTRGGNRRACVEGPIFAAEELVFDD
jgi:NAD(P)H-flavin reductase